MKPRHPWKTYLRAAFRNAYNLGALGLAAGLGLIFFKTIGPGIFFLATGLEIGYLYMLTTNPRFIRYIDSKLGAEQHLDHGAQREKLWPLIDKHLQQRYKKLEKKAERLAADDIMALRRNDPFYQENRMKVATLLTNYLRIVVALTRYKKYLENTDPEEIQLNIDRLEEEILGAHERIQSVKRKNIEILVKRLQKIEKAKTNSEYLFAQMETIEDTMGLVVDQAITLSDPKGMGMQIDNLLGNLQETELIAAEMEAFSELDEGLEMEIYSHRELE